NTFAGSVVIDVNDGSSVAMHYLIFTGGEVGLWVHNHSTRFDALYLTAHHNADDGIRIEADADLTTVDHLTAYYNGGSGITIATGAVKVLNNPANGNGGDGCFFGGMNTAVVNNNVSHHNGADGFGFVMIGSATVNNDLAYNNGGNGFSTGYVGASMDYDIAHH